MGWKVKRHSSFLIIILLCSLIVFLSSCGFNPDIATLVVEAPPDNPGFGSINTNSDVNNSDQPAKQPQPSTEDLISNPRPDIKDGGMGNPWKQINAPIKNDTGQRSAQAYLDVISQFDVQNSYPGRYRPGEATSNTRCNIFAGDVMRAMGAPLPTKGDLGKGAGNSKTTDPMTANARDTHDWLNQQKDGWRKIDINNPADLQLLRDHLLAGKPAVASDPGHIAALRPDNIPGDLSKDSLDDLHIAQAGAHNYNDIALGQAGYGNKFNPDFYIHD